MNFEPDKAFEKTWTFINDGKFPWPVNTCLIFKDGTNFGEKYKYIDHSV